MLLPPPGGLHTPHIISLVSTFPSANISSSQLALPSSSRKNKSDIESRIGFNSKISHPSPKD
ncbi:hypothetical protein Lal_00021432 [Lupinus albus]|nr:hypothetical protein Lal_00021432 [Lupinus albus]